MLRETVNDEFVEIVFLNLFIYRCLPLISFDSYIYDLFMNELLVSFWRSTSLSDALFYLDLGGNLLFKCILFDYFNYDDLEPF